MLMTLNQSGAVFLVFFFDRVGIQFDLVILNYMIELFINSGHCFLRNRSDRNILRQQKQRQRRRTRSVHPVCKCGTRPQRLYLGANFVSLLYNKKNLLQSKNLLLSKRKMLQS